MAAPSNIRINPFIGDGGTTNYVDFTEVHIIPAVSPFVVRLNEVPQKKDPSNMKVVYVNETTGAPTTTALTEVAATPGAGEFRPDYSTNADGDEDWNTGLIEFSSADAGKIIQVSYTGMGTLAGVKNNRFPSWWIDRGDGSDGDFIPTGNTTIYGEKNYRSVYIPNGIIVSVEGFVQIKCQGSFINLGQIVATGSGSHGGAGGVRIKESDSYVYSAGGAGSFGVANNGGAGGSGTHSAGGAGGAALCAGLRLLYSEEVLALLARGLICIGAGGGGGGTGVNQFDYVAGGAGGSGGGFISVVADSFKNVGSIVANGNSGGWGGGGGGGGAGGCIVIIAITVIAQGTITANGGSGGGAASGFGGSGAAGGTGGNGYIIVKELGVM